MQLKQIADQMYDQLVSQNRDWRRRNLFGGLSIILEKRGAWWRLALARETTWPSRDEERIAADAFGVPVPRRWDRTKTTKRGSWYVTECLYRKV